MPPDLTIGPIGPVAFEAEAAAPSLPHLGLSAAPASLPVANPDLRNDRVVLDPGSDRVVLEFLDATGALINSLPSQRQLEAYRLAAASGGSDTPVIRAR